MRKKKVLRCLILSLIIIWMIIVFELSNQSGDESSGVSQWITSKIFSEEDVQVVAEAYIRKIAHLSEYAARRIFISSYVFDV